LEGTQREIVAIDRSAADQPLPSDVQMCGDQHYFPGQHPEAGFRRTGEFAAVEIVVGEEPLQILDDFVAAAPDGPERVDPVGVVGVDV
jgi:hypothetical protein